MKLWSVILLAAIVTAGCVRTVSERKAGAVPLVKDKIEGRYERSMQEVYEAAKDVLELNGTLLNELTLHEGEGIVRALEGRVDKRRIWIRVEPVDETVTSVVVQVRTSGGGADMRLAHELEKQIAIKLAVR